MRKNQSSPLSIRPTAVAHQKCIVMPTIIVMLLHGVVLFVTKAGCLGLRKTLTVVVVVVVAVAALVLSMMVMIGDD